MLWATQTLHAAGIDIKGVVHEPSIKKIYLYTVYDDGAGYIFPLDSVHVANGHFAYRNDSLRSQILFITATPQTAQVNLLKTGKMLFFESGSNVVEIARNANGKLEAALKSSPLDQRYQQFAAEKHRLTLRPQLDSLDALFIAARAQGNTEEMRRIRTLSDPIYEEGMRNFREWRKQRLLEDSTSAFGTYLYYTYKMLHAEVKTAEQLQVAQALLARFDKEARQTDYFLRMSSKIEQWKKNIVGTQAPPILGLDRNDKPIALADFKGRYVLVDFWSSGCTWCRAETPHFKKALAEFGNKNFTILGVSTDLGKAEWIKAIEEDGANWNHLLLPRKTRNDILKAYSIVSIPEILLIDPQGRIIAKNLRGEEIYQAVRKALQP